MLPGSIVVKYKSFFLNAPAISQNFKIQQCMAYLTKSETLFTVKRSGEIFNPKIKMLKAFNYNMI